MIKKKDLFLFFVSALIAILLWFYANLFQNPEVVRSLTVRLRYKNVPSNYQFDVKQKEITIYIGGKRLYLLKALHNNLKLYDAYLDLSSLKEGINKIKPQVKEMIPYGFKIVSTDPRYVEIRAQKLVEKEKMVNVIISGQPKKGYYLEKYEIKPSLVKVKGIKSLVTSVTQVAPGIQLNISGLSSDNLFLLNLNAYNAEGEIVKGVKIIPPTAVAKIYIKKYVKKKVPIKIERKGELKRGYKLQKMNLTPETVVIEGIKSEIKTVKEFRIKIDITNLDHNQVFVQELEIPKDESFYFEGLKKSKKVTISLEIIPKIIERKFSNVPLKTLLNQSPKYLYKIAAPEKVDIRLKGPELVLERVFSDEIVPYVDVKGKKDGDHTLKIGALLPKDITLVRIYPRYARVIILKREEKVKKMSLSSNNKDKHEAKKEEKQANE